MYKIVLAMLAVSLPILAARITVAPGQSPEPAERDVRGGHSTNDISLVAQPLPGPPAILENAGGQDTCIAVARQATTAKQCEIDPNQRITGSRIEGFLVRNFSGDGIFLLCADEWAVMSNTAVHNTAGILTFILPQEDVMLSRGNHVHHNFVYENNSPNSCLDPADDVCAVPPGIGILVVGGDHNEIDNNRAVGNQTFGVALSDLCTAFGFPANLCPLFQFAAIPQFTKIRQNNGIGNGASPGSAGKPGADLIWSENGKGNCWQENQALIVSPNQLPACKSAP